MERGAGMALRSKRAPQFTEVFRCQATPQDIQEDLEKMSRALTRLKRRRLQRSNPPQEAIEDKHSYHDYDKSGGSYVQQKKRPSVREVVEEEGMDESQSRSVKPEFRPWSKHDSLNYHHTFQQ